MLRLVAVWVSVAVGFGLPVLVNAQAAPGPVIEQLQVDLWPRYDDPRLLVIYKGELAAPPEQPLRFPIPAEADVNAVAYLNDADQLISLTWESPASGDQRVVTFTPQTANFQLEYYIDVISPGPERSFTVNIDVDGQPVKTLGIAVQQPAGASNLKGEPTLSGPVAGFQGLSYFTRQVEDVQPGQTVQQTVTYTQPDDALTVEQIQPVSPEPADAQPQATADSSGPGFSTNFTGRSATRFWLPVGATAIILVGLILVGVGAWRARQEGQVTGEAGRSRGSRKSESRRARRRRGREVHPGPAGQAQEEAAKFCHQCGTPFEPEDRFCAECGAPRRSM